MVNEAEHDMNRLALLHFWESSYLLQKVTGEPDMYVFSVHCNPINFSQDPVKGDYLAPNFCKFGYKSPTTFSRGEFLQKVEGHSVLPSHTEQL